MKIKKMVDAASIGFNDELLNARIEEMNKRPKPELHPELKRILGQLDNRQNNQS